MTTIFTILACWAVSFLFAGIEAGLLAVDPIRLRHQVNQRRPAALRLYRLTQQPARLLVTVLLITNFANIVALLLITRAVVVGLGNIGFLLAIIIATPIHLFLLNVLPKSMFRRFPFRALAPLGGILGLASRVLSPLLVVGELVARGLFPRRPAEERRLFAAREELKQIAVQSEREGSLTAAERAMIHNVVDFRHIRARDVMVPLANTVTVQPDTPASAVVTLSKERAIDRFPVVSANGSAVGLVNILDLLLDLETPAPVERYMRRIVTAEEREPAYRLMRRLRAARTTLAAVVDGQRHLIGIVASEDVIKRIVQNA